MAAIKAAINTFVAIWANSTLTLAVKIAKTRIINPIRANKPSSIILILFDILMDSDREIAYY